MAATPYHLWRNEAMVERKQQMGKPSLLVSAYSLGKAAFDLSPCRCRNRVVYAHSTILKTNEVIQKNGFRSTNCQRHTRQMERQRMGRCTDLFSASLSTDHGAGKIAPWQRGEASGWWHSKNSETAMESLFTHFRPCRLARHTHHHKRKREHKSILPCTVMIRL